MVVQHVRAHARAAPGVARVPSGQAVLALEVGERFAAGHRPFAASARTDGRQRFAIAVCPWKFVSLSAARMSA